VGHEVRDRALATIERRIITGELAPGARLDEELLAAELAAEPSVVREALACLRGDGLVRGEDDGAFAVSELDENELREAYPIVLLLEGLAVRTTPEFTPECLARLRDVNEAMAREADDAFAVADRDYEFHEELVRLCGNEQILATLRPLKLSLLRVERHYFADRAIVDRSVGQHRRIVAALERGEIEAAALAVEANFRDAMAAMLRQIRA